MSTRCSVASRTCTVKVASSLGGCAPPVLLLTSTTLFSPSPSSRGSGGNSQRRSPPAGRSRKAVALRRTAPPPASVPKTCHSSSGTPSESAQGSTSSLPAEPTMSGRPHHESTSAAASNAVSRINVCRPWTA
ncbi:ORFL234C [Human betaherpesvirus 5]|nr:ORFL234C [Human betaherpesvirus 5]QHX40603.1 ORFL234C [Human betaherpesvirus 5]